MKWDIFIQKGFIYSTSNTHFKELFFVSFVFMLVSFSLQMLFMLFICVWFFDGLFRNMFTYSNEVCNLKCGTKDKTFV